MKRGAKTEAGLALMLSARHRGSGQLSRQPGFREFPVSHDRVWRHVQRFCGLLDAQTAEEPQLDDLALSLVVLRERLEGLGFFPVGESGPAALGALIRAETQRWQQIVRDTGIRAQ